MKTISWIIWYLYASAHIDFVMHPFLEPTIHFCVLFFSLFYFVMHNSQSWFKCPCAYRLWNAQKCVFWFGMHKNVLIFLLHVAILEKLVHFLSQKFLLLCAFFWFLEWFIMIITSCLCVCVLFSKLSVWILFLLVIFPWSSCLSILC